MRKNIENEYYKNQILECGVGHDPEDFDPRNCEGVIRCISIGMSKFIRKEDLKIMSDKMKWSDDDKSTIFTYFRENLGINGNNSEIDSTMKSCARQYRYEGA